MLGFDVLDKWTEQLLPISDHPSFNRPPVTVPLWRYNDLAKLVDLLTSQTLWFSNAEILALNDPHEGQPDAVQFPHRLWHSIEEVPNGLRAQILGFGSDQGLSADQAFTQWFRLEEQSCIYAKFGRRNFYVSCWHAANHESVAMWQVYASPGAGVAIVTNGGRLEHALSPNTEELHLGAINYWEPGTIEIGTSNAFNRLMAKRANFSYEQEVRIVYWDAGDFHNPLPELMWNEEKMQFEGIVDDPRPLQSGRSFPCDINVLIEQIIVSPSAPPWYLPMVERLRDQLGFSFPVSKSRLLDPPSPIP